MGATGQKLEKEWGGEEGEEMQAVEGWWHLLGMGHGKR